MEKHIDSNSTADTVNLSLDSIEEDVTQPWINFLYRLSKFHLDSLHAIFNEIGLDKEEFITAVDDVFGNSRHSIQALCLFDEIAKTEELREITWTKFLDFIVEHGEVVTLTKLDLALTKIFSPPHVKRETVVKIVLIETELYFCYAILSKYGRVGIYDGNLNFLTSYQIMMTREDISKTDEERRRRNRWITDAIFLRDVLMFIVTNSARSLIVYDASGLKHMPLWLILGIPNVIQCVHYCPESNQKIATLYMGDSNGQIISLEFPQSKTGLFRKKHNDKMSLYYWQELPGEKEFVVIKIFEQFRIDEIRNVKYLPENDSIVSCSRDENASVAISHVGKRRQPYIFKMKRGAACFSLSWVKKILITGSDDGIIRMWDVFSASKPTGVLAGHRHGVIDIQIFENHDLFLSVSRDGVLKLWNIITQKCIQTLSIKYPSFQILGKFIEWGTNSIYPGPKRCDPSTIWERSNILIPCCNYIANVKLIFHEHDYNVDMPVLSPPPLQNSVLIPKTWKVCEKKVNLETSGEIIKIVDDRLKELSFILDRNIISENNLNSEMNYRIANLEAKKLQMKNSVQKCAPYLALDLHEIQELTLSADLPVPNRRRIQSLVQKTQRLLSAASLRSQLFEQSSSRSRSSRSSVVDFDF